MEKTDINRRLHEALGREFHIGPLKIYYVPDYIADPRLVIEAMREYCGEGKRFEWDVSLNLMYKQDTLFDLIMDKTGKLTKLALEFIEGR